MSLVSATGSLVSGLLALGIPLSVAGALLSGCARGPVLSEAADRLSGDSRAVLASGTALLGPPGVRPRVVTDGTRPCAGGLAQRVFRADLPLQPGATGRVTADRATYLSLELIRSRGYRLDGPPSRHAFSMSRSEPAVTMTVRVHGGAHPVLELGASTPCLNRG